VRLEACEAKPHQLLCRHVSHSALLEALDIVRSDSVDPKVDDVLGGQVAIP
jgi:hypothetical protein